MKELVLVRNFFRILAMILFVRIIMFILVSVICQKVNLERNKGDTMFKRLKKYFWLRRLGVNHPWKASGNKSFIQMG